jgi:hypothetical protein
MPLRSIAALLLVIAMPVHAATPHADLTTISERSGFLKTGRYDEVIALCDAFAKAYPDAVRCIEFGTTPEDRPMKALVASTSGALTPVEARKRGLPVVLIQGGIHAGEIDGKDAGFLALREILEGKAAKGALDKLVWVFVPVFNVDGHERFGAWNRPNQRGPVEMGWRTTAQNYNLNRDYVKADTPEMQAMHALINAWDPLAVVDLHVTNGAKFEHDVSIQVEPVNAGDEALRKIGTQWRDAVITDLGRQGSLPLPFYPSFVIQDDPSSGFEDGVAPPRFSSGYFWLVNRLGMLVETHSWKEYPVRVRITRNTVLSVLEQVAAHGNDWLRTAQEADARARQLPARTQPLAYAASTQSRVIDFRGYAYSRTHSEISGALMTRYDEGKPQVWTIPLRDDIRPSVSVQPPRAGYLVPAAHAAWVGTKLKQHGIAFTVLGPQTEVTAETFRAETAKAGTQSFEGHQAMTVTGHWQPESRDLAAGALFVPIAQSRSRLVMSMLEPLAPDSLLAWGAFNNAFERKEYMEDYVAEEVARDMLAADPALKARFEQRLQADPAFAASPQARLDFFARLHSSWDEQYYLYPVLRIDTIPQ